MKKLYALVLFGVLSVAIPAFAADDPAPDAMPAKKAMTVEEKKEKAISWIDQRISALQDHKKCISDAKTEDDLKACREKFKEERESMQKGMKERKRGMEK